MSDTRKSETPEQRARRLETMRQYKLRNAEQIRKRAEEYRARKKQEGTWGDLRREYGINYRKKHHIHLREYDIARNKEKTNARSRIRSRIKRGTLERGYCCICGATNAQAHHEDYSKPLEIFWLCPKHHKDRHSNLLELPEDKLVRIE